MMVTPEFWRLQLALYAVESTWKKANSGLLVLDVGNAAFARISRGLQRELAGDLLPTVIEQTSAYFNSITGLSARLSSKEIANIITREQAKAVDSVSWKAAELFEGRNGTRAEVVKAADNGARTSITATDAHVQGTLGEKPDAKRRKIRLAVVLSSTACEWCKTALEGRLLKPSSAEGWRGAHKACGCRLTPTTEDDYF